eukprot:GILJ01008869.1.p1 GENE.GILJ01008869.1~~GILJ01008869.1.p1  ORF type:complete len:587 (+),score=106.47 GILJ01008869.1:39-1763(+)
MKVDTLEISWHGDRERVLSVDFHAPTGRFVTAGADNDIRMWRIELKDDGKHGVKHVADISGHLKPVNVVRFSPNGLYLASGSDDGSIYIWKKNDNPSHAPFGAEADETPQEEYWSPLKMLRGHSSDVYDLAWSPDCGFLLSGSVDNSAIIWNLTKGKVIQRLEGHNNFVQGVAWDPESQFLITQSSDRTARIYKLRQTTHKTEATLTQTLVKRESIVPAASTTETAEQNEDGEAGKETSKFKHRLFLDETAVPSFFRRPCWTPDGSLLLTPAGQFQSASDSLPLPTVYVFTRNSLNTPVMHLPGAAKAAIAVRPCPILFKLKPTDKENLIDLPYRMIFAVATIDTLLLYDTQRRLPVALSAGNHYTSLSDISWSADARYIVVSSTDGYCSIVSFAEGELGELLPEADYPEIMKKNKTTFIDIEREAKKKAAEKAAAALAENNKENNKQSNKERTASLPKDGTQPQTSVVIQDDVPVSKSDDASSMEIDVKAPSTAVSADAKVQDGADNIAVSTERRSPKRPLEGVEDMSTSTSKSTPMQVDGAAENASAVSQPEVPVEPQVKKPRRIVPVLVAQ